MHAAPPLPVAWPFPSRNEAAASSWKRLERNLPDLGAGWQLITRDDLSFDAPDTSLAFGRGGVRRYGSVVVRPYRRGGWLRHLNPRLYASSDRFARECAVHEAIWNAGFPTVEPLGYGFRRRFGGVEGLYLTRFVEAAPWPTCWERSDEVIPQLTVALQALATWGLLAPDLNATNVLVRSDGSVLTLDWDRAHWTDESGLLARYHARLARSLRKLGAPDEVVTRLSESLGT